MVALPEPGITVWTGSLRRDGRWSVIGFETLEDGRVVVHDHPSTVQGRLQGPRRIAGPVGKPACEDGAFATYSVSWASAFRWRYKIASTPSGIAGSAALKAIKRAVNNITRADNDCGLPDRVDATHKYLGTTTKFANISSLSVCQARDGVSVVAFGDLLAAELGHACWWSRNGSIVEADVKLNKVDHSWTVPIAADCLTHFSVEAVATHEFGHAFGLDHVSAANHPNLTMSPGTAPCQKSETTLGLGDVRGLESLY